MPIYPKEVCPFCGENPEITWICEDCQNIFCDDCVIYVQEEEFDCANCRSKDINVDKHSRLYCQECGEQNNIRRIGLTTPTCRNCESKNVIKIEEKQQLLIKKYKIGDLKEDSPLSKIQYIEEDNLFRLAHLKD